MAKQTEFASTDSMVSARKPLQQIQNNNKNLHSNLLTLDKQGLKTIILRLIITLQNDSDGWQIAGFLMSFYQ